MCLLVDTAHCERLLLGQPLRIGSAKRGLIFIVRRDSEARLQERLTIGVGSSCNRVALIAQQCCATMCPIICCWLLAFASFKKLSPVKNCRQRRKQQEMRLLMRSIDGEKDERRNNGGNRSEAEETAGRVQLCGSLNARMNSLEVN